MNIEKDILKTIENDPKVKRYKELEKYINENKLINEKLNELKDLQKELVHAKSLEKGKKYNDVLTKYNLLLKELEEIPLLLEYLDLQADINFYLQNISKTINDALIVKLGD